MGMNEYEVQPAEYMKQYRANKIVQLGGREKQKSMNTLTDAIKEIRARKELLEVTIIRQQLNYQE